MDVVGLVAPEVEASDIDSAAEASTFEWNVPATDDGCCD